MLTPDAQAALHRGNSVKIGLLDDNEVKTGKPVGGGGGGVRKSQE